MTWILSSVEPHLVLNLRPYKTTAAMWNYLHTIYNQDMRWLISHKEVSKLRNIFLVFKLFGLIIPTLFMLMFLL